MLRIAVEPDRLTSIGTISAFVYCSAACHQPDPLSPQLVAPPHQFPLAPPPRNSLLHHQPTPPPKTSAPPTSRLYQIQSSTCCIDSPSRYQRTKSRKEVSAISAGTTRGPEWNSCAHNRSDQSMDVHEHETHEQSNNDGHRPVR